jgi:hypothetical protein
MLQFSHYLSLQENFFFLLFGRCLTQKNSTKIFSKEGPARKLMSQAFLDFFYSCFKFVHKIITYLYFFNMSYLPIFLSAKVV